jgi:hypothetical protein
MFAVMAYTNTPHACAACSVDPGGGVFYNNAPAGWYANPRSRRQIDFRVRFSFMHIFSGDDRLETVDSP